MADRPEWTWFQRASDLVTARDYEAAEEVIAEALTAGHLWRVSLLVAPNLEPLRGRPRFERLADEARRRVLERNFQPLVLVAQPADNVHLRPLLLVLHGARGNAERELETWRPATEMGWIVAAGQSSQPATEDGFCWDPPQERVWHDLRVISAQLPPHARVVIAGFSQGAWVAINAALRADVIVAGTVLMIGPFAGPDPDVPGGWRRLRVSIVVGERDQYRDRVTQFAAQLRDRQHHVSVEVIPNLGHEYPHDFVRRLPALLRP